MRSPSKCPNHSGDQVDHPTLQLQLVLVQGTPWTVADHCLLRHHLGQTKWQDGWRLHIRTYIYIYIYVCMYTYTMILGLGNCEYLRILFTRSKRCENYHFIFLPMFGKTRGASQIHVAQGSHVRDCNDLKLKDVIPFRNILKTVEMKVKNPSFQIKKTRKIYISTKNKKNKYNKQLTTI